MLRMPENNKTHTNRGRRGFLVLRPGLAIIVFAALFLAGCAELEKTTPEPFFATTPPPPAQEIRWSNGKTPKSFDPAEAAAPPETDIARAVYEGLTDTDPVTLAERPGVAEKWEASDDLREWTFHLRENAKWSNGDDLTAQDFVRSWKRLAAKPDKVQHSALLKNFADFSVPENPENELDREPAGIPNSNTNTNANANTVRQATPTPANTNSASIVAVQSPTPDEVPVDDKFGIVAVDDHTLKISLIMPDKDLPKLVANPIFLPIHKNDEENSSDKLNASIVTNGPFRIAGIGPEGITLEKAEYYWNRDSVKLDRVRFVPMENAEQALNAYRAGEVDVVTNASFEPLVVKLLSPYDDFRRTRHGAVNFYEINRERKPFSDRRVREALAISIERERVTEGEMEGTTQPAFGFSPFDDGKQTAKIVQDTAKARSLLADAGFPEGVNFPVIRLVVNRNDAQQRIARSVAKMWKQNLNLETEIIVKEPAELQTARESGDFDVIRRGSVLPTTDELANFIAIFGIENVRPSEGVSPTATPEFPGEPIDSDLIPEVEMRPIIGGGPKGDGIILSEEDAIYEMHGIPLYFSVSYSLVKPYVNGFELNSLDAPSLKDVNIDSSWQPNGAKAGS